MAQPIELLIHPIHADKHVTI